MSDGGHDVPSSVYALDVGAWLSPYLQEHAGRSPGVFFVKRGDYSGMRQERQVH